MRVMGFLDRLFGRGSGSEASQPRQPDASPPADLTDEQALERYRYLVRTAPPDAIEQAHEEAFAKLTPEQRQKALRDLNATMPEGERATGDDPRSLARTATRAEVSQPGTVERAFGGGVGMGGALLGSFAAAFAGTVIAQSLFSELAGAEAGGEGDGSAEGDTGDAGADAGGDVGGGDFGGGDFGGGDFGGGGGF
jgi:hypothetical protein